MDFGKLIKNGLKAGLSLYVAAYIAVSGHVVFDYNFNHRQKVEDVNNLPNSLIIKKYKTKIDNREKMLTLVGETHFYNKLEHQIALEIVASNENFATECGVPCRRKSTPIDAIVYTALIPAFVYSEFYHHASGRTYSNLGEIAKSNGFRVYQLENGSYPIGKLKFKDKLAFIVPSMILGITAPIFYYKAKKEFGNHEFKSPNLLENPEIQRILVTERDIEMANSIEQLLKKPRADKLVASFGLVHFEGIKKNLSEKIPLEEIK